MHLQFFTQESLGQTRSLTPEGFLVCSDVPLARVGTLLYAEGEVPVEAGPNGIISIERSEDEVFAPQAIASFNGKPVTNDHPPETVDPDNWRLYSIGHVMNPRRGDGRAYDADYLYADLLISDRDAIRDVLAGKREVSAGYDATYDQTAPGYGKQSNIIGNHVALVDRGRCGPRCAIGDRSMPVTRNKFAAFRDRIMKAHRAHDEEGVTREINGMIGEMISGTNDELNPKPTNEWEGAPTEKAGEKSVVVHVHAQPHGGNSPMSTAAPAAPQEKPENGDADPAAAAQPVGGAQPAAAADPIATIMQRLDAIEQAIAAMSQDEAPDDDAQNPTEDHAARDTETSGDGPSGTGEGNPSDPPFDAENPENVTEGGSGKGEPTDTGEDPGPAPGDKPTNDAAPRAMTGDSRALTTGFQEMTRLAAILVPDVKMPTFDARTDRKTTLDRMCAFRKNTLAQAYKSEDVKPHIDAILDGPPDFKKMTCDAANAVFIAAARAVRDANNMRMSNPRPQVTRGFGGSGAPTPAEINRRNRERFNIGR